MQLSNQGVQPQHTTTRSSGRYGMGPRCPALGRLRLEFFAFHEFKGRLWIWGKVPERSYSAEAAHLANDPRAAASPSAGVR